MSFPDFFSSHADQYAEFRPHYPQALFSFVAAQCAARNHAWDCATGNGQAASGLAPHFTRVIGTDASKRQVAHAVRNERISYCIAVSERVPFASQSVDLVTIAQALHWMKLGLFYSEVRRVLKPDGIFAVWCYNLLHIAPQIDSIVLDFYSRITGPYWTPERKFVEEGYRTLPFPFAEMDSPQFEMEAEWDLSELIGFLETWSASQKYTAALGTDPVDQIRENLLRAWGDPTARRHVSWPLSLRIGVSH